MPKKAKPRRRLERWLTTSQVLDRFLKHPQLKHELPKKRDLQLAYVRRVIRKAQRRLADGGRLVKLVDRELLLSASVLDEMLSPDPDDGPTDSQVHQVLIEHGSAIRGLRTHARGHGEKISNILQRLENIEAELKVISRAMAKGRGEK